MYLVTKSYFWKSLFFLWTSFNNISSNIKIFHFVPSIIINIDIIPRRGLRYAVSVFLFSELGSLLFHFCCVCHFHPLHYMYKITLSSLYLSTALFFCFDEFITADAFDMLTFYFLPFFHLFSTDSWLAHFECIPLFWRYIPHTLRSPYNVSLISFMQLWCIYIFTSILVYSLSNPNHFLTIQFTLL